MKKSKYLIIILALFILIGVNKVRAFDLNAPSSAYLNSDVAITIDAIGIVARVDCVSSNENILAGNKSLWLENEKRTIYFSARNIGVATITATTSKASNMSGDDIESQSVPVTITVIKKNSGITTTPSIDVNKTYDKNNYLKSLSIDGYTLTPEFNKDTLEYSVELEPGTEKVNVNASKEKNTSSIKGTGEVSVSEGINSISIVVTAENGNERTYVIKASVVEKNPIKVTIDNKDYTVVKKENLLIPMDGYEKTTVKINDFDIPALYNDVTKVTLLGLKDKDGNISMFSYNSSTGKYFEYKEFTFDRMNLYVHEPKNTDYEKTTIKLNDKEVPAYKIKGTNDYYLIYATNTVTGYEGYYLYDVKENSVQRYDSTMLDKISADKDKYLSIVIVLSSVCFFAMLFLLIEVNRDNKRKNED